MIRLSWLTVHELQKLISDAQSELAARKQKRPRAASPLTMTPNELQRAKARRLLGGGGPR